ncbi:MAG TPA: regulatory protein RecX [Acidobacteriota bacterium]|nr:regulatory protein RecX [Acidobacteriota bacterium]
MSDPRHSRPEPKELMEFLPDESLLREELVRAMRRIARIPRTEAETREYLRQRKLPEISVESIIDTLKQEGFLDDARFAKGYVRFRLGQGYGPARIRRELRDKGVTGSAADFAIAAAREDRDELEILRNVLAKRVRVKGEPREPRELKNLGTFLERRGFDYNLVREELEVYFDRIKNGGGKS